MIILGEQVNLEVVAEPNMVVGEYVRVRAIVGVKKGAPVLVAVRAFRAALLHVIMTVLLAATELVRRYLSMINPVVYATALVMVDV